MRKAVQVDDNQFCKIQEKLAQLEVRWLLFKFTLIFSSFYRISEYVITILSVQCMREGVVSECGLDWPKTQNCFASSSHVVLVVLC